MGVIITSGGYGQAPAVVNLHIFYSRCYDSCVKVQSCHGFHPERAFPKTRSDCRSPSNQECTLSIRLGIKEHQRVAEQTISQCTTLNQLPDAHSQGHSQVL
jgi:hypothetical protein